MYIPFSFFGSGSSQPVLFNFYQVYTCGSCDTGSAAIVGVFSNLNQNINNVYIYDPVINSCGLAFTSSFTSASYYFIEEFSTYGSGPSYGNPQGCGPCNQANWNNILIPSGCFKYTFMSVGDPFYPGPGPYGYGTASYIDCTGSAVTTSFTCSFVGDPYGAIFIYNVCAQSKPNIFNTDVSLGWKYECSGTCYPNQFVTNGLVLHLVSSSYTASTGIWRDISGNCNDAFVSSSPNPINWNPTLTASQYGWNFNPTYSQSLQFPSILNSTPSSSYTIQMYISTSNYENNYDLFSKIDTNYRGWQTRLQSGSLIYENRGYTVGEYPASAGTGSLRLYTWVLDGVNNISNCYVNGASRSDYQATYIVPFATSSVPLNFGWNTTTLSSYFSGSVSSLLVYNRALSPDEIFYNYGYISASTGYVEVPCSHSVQPQPQPNLTPFPISGSLIVRNTLISNSGSIWYDVSGNGNNALVSGSTLSLSGSLGYEFNGTNNYLTYPEPLTATPSGSWTLQWYGTMYNDSINRDLYCKDYYNDGWDILYSGAGGLTYRDEAGSDKGISITNVSATKTLWTLVGNDAANTIITYKNGGLVGTMSAGAVNGFNASSTPFKFGFNTNTDATYFKGTIAELLVYNKGLSASEVSQSYTYLNTYFP